MLLHQRGNAKEGAMRARRPTRTRQVLGAIILFLPLSTLTACRVEIGIEPDAAPTPTATRAATSTPATPTVAQAHATVTTAAATATMTASATATMRGQAPPPPTLAVRRGTPSATPVAMRSTLGATATPVESAPPSATGGAGTAWGRALQPLSGGQLYTDPRGRFSVRVPAGWRQTTSRGAAVAFRALSGPTALTVTLTTVGRGQDSLERYRGVLARQPGRRLLDEERVVVAGRHAYRDLAQVTVAGATEDSERVYVVAGGLAHLLSFTAAPQDIGDAQIVFDGIAGSYRPCS